jgi:hypothetical protein
LYCPINSAFGNYQNDFYVYVEYLFPWPAFLSCSTMDFDSEEDEGNLAIFTCSNLLRHSFMD